MPTDDPRHSRLQAEGLPITRDRDFGPGAGRLTLWVDAQLSPHLAPWLAENFDVEAFSVRRLALRDSKDAPIFEAAREAQAVVVTKDFDFVRLVDEVGSPPQILWLTCGNTSNQYLKSLLRELLPAALRLLERGESVVEIRDLSSWGGRLSWS